MLRIVSITLFVALLALPATAFAQGSGLDAYTENPPTAGGGGGGGGGTDSTAVPQSATGSDSGVAGSGSTAGTASDGSGAPLTEAAAANAGSTPRGQLPATGFDETALMAVIGAALLIAGLGLQRMSRSQA